jgi:hypothetical protein
LKSGRRHWFWRENRLGQIRVEFLNLFRDLERIEGVSFDALESILFTINPWSIDDYFLKILITMVSKIGCNKIDVEVVRVMQLVPRGDRCLAYELFFFVVSGCNGDDNHDVTSPLHHEIDNQNVSSNVDIQKVSSPIHFEIDFFIDKEIKFILEQGVKNIPHISTLWGPSFGAARYQWLAKHYRKVECVSDTFSAILLSTDWSESTIPERCFLDFLQLFKKKGNSIYSTSSQPYELSFTIEEFVKLLSSFTTETIMSNWTCLIGLLDIVFTPPEVRNESEDIKDKNKNNRKFLKTFETVCKNSDITSDKWKCAISILSVFALSATFFEGENIFDSQLYRNLINDSKIDPTGPASKILNEFTYSQRKKCSIQHLK